VKYYRIKCPNAAYHITSRCNNKEFLFNRDCDFVRYLKTLSRCKEKYDFSLHDYTIMHNHVHLLIRVADSGDVSRIMQSINRQYARWYNTHYERKGHFWEGRFDSVIVTDDSQLLAVMRYIDYNAVRAGRCQHPADWKYSGTRFYLNGEKNSLIDAPETYIALGPTDESRQKAYASIFALSL